MTLHHELMEQEARRMILDGASFRKVKSATRVSFNRFKRITREMVAEGIVLPPVVTNGVKHPRKKSSSGYVAEQRIRIAIEKANLSPYWLRQLLMFVEMQLGSAIQKTGDKSNGHKPSEDECTPEMRMETHAEELAHRAKLQARREAERQRKAEAAQKLNKELEQGKCVRDRWKERHPPA
jgi:hypothetical protein